jgi:hypothetical protein
MRDLAARPIAKSCFRCMKLARGTYQKETAFRNLHGFFPQADVSLESSQRFTVENQ